ncbi:MAG: DNA primase [Oscillospiraceae bacterium]|nr:DNA primase [Oscillospiraceae bacterium]
MAFSESFLEELSARCDIYDVVSRYVTLKKSGSNWFGLCPFHGEKTASFSVNTEKQIFHCFGCGAGGSVYNFIMKIENLTFPESVEFLANMVGMELPKEDFHDNRKRLYALNLEAARYFRDVLFSDKGRAGLSYLTNRGLSMKTIRRFGLGFAPDEWSDLIDAMTAKGFSKNELLTLGLAKTSRKGTLYDQFRNRVIFPIIDIRGNVIAFGGRVMDGSQPKYLNSPESPVFSKSHNLFALNYAKKAQGRRLILAEGYMDVIALHQAGFSQAVASLGTSLTVDQAKLMKRFADEVIISYDADNAGQTAAARAADILKNAELSIKILKIPGAKDPDEFIKANGGEAFASLLDSSEEHMMFTLERIRAKYDLSDNEGKINFLKEAAAALSRLPSPIEREIYASRAAEMAQIPKDALSAEIERRRKAYLRDRRKQEVKKTMEPARAAQPLDRNLHYADVKSARAEEGIISMLASNASFIRRLDADGIEAQDFSAPFLGSIYSRMHKLIEDGQPVSAAALSQGLSDAEMSELGRILSTPSGGDEAQALENYIFILKEGRAKRGADPQQDPMLALRDLYRQKKAYGGKTT